MKKSDIAQAYEKYLWPKCSRTTYYKNIKAWMNIIDALKPVPMEVRYKPGKIVSKRFVEEMAWYRQQEWEKASRSRFYQRLYQGWSKEEAILLNVPIHCRKVVWKSKQAYVRPKTPVKKVENEDVKYIKVAYKKEEARIFSKEYENMIRDLQDRYNATDDLVEAREINERLEKLVKEYQIFLECQSPVKEAVR